MPQGRGENVVLTNEQIKSITVGAPFIVDTDEGLKFYKYCPELYDVWKAHREVLAERMLATSGVRLDFSTNSKHLTIELEKPRRFEIFISRVKNYVGLFQTQVLSFCCGFTLDNRALLYKERMGHIA